MGSTPAENATFEVEKMTASSFYATTIFLDGHGVLLIGSSGSGKSLLALELMSQGGFLVADDVTFLTVDDGKIYASANSQWKGCIEARGVGILSGFSTKQNVRIDYCIELTEDVPDRIPFKIQTFEYCGIEIPLFRINKNEKFLPTLVKIAGKIISKEVSLMSFNEMHRK